MFKFIKKIFSSRDGYSLKLNDGDTLIVYADNGMACGGCVLPLSEKEEDAIKEKFKSVNSKINIVVLPTNVRLGELLKN